MGALYNFTLQARCAFRIVTGKKVKLNKLYYRPIGIDFLSGLITSENGDRKKNRDVCYLNNDGYYLYGFSQYIMNRESRL